ncbi:MAG: molecular chaperone TorD family protein [Thermodesulfobacteriota bacterium]
MNGKAELSDRELCLVRLRFLDLAKSFFCTQPDGEMIGRWRGIFAALGGEQTSESLDKAVAELAATLDECDLQDLKDEYYDLFVNPYSKELLPLNGSYHLDGRSFGPSLVKYRQLLKDSQLIKDPEITESEDSLEVMLDTLATLVREEKNGNEMSRHFQDRLLTEFLQPTVKELTGRVQKNSRAGFYRQCIAFVDAYLELENGLVETGKV